MSLETASYIKGLVSTNPDGNDPKSEGDDHLRLIKAVLLSQFSGFTEGLPITITETQLNNLVKSGMGGAVIQFTDPNAIPNISGFYGATTALVNAPPGAQGGDTVIHQFYSASSKTQIWTIFTTGRTFVRTWSGSAWTAWQAVVFGAKQTSAFDLTAGALEAVGAFGVGATGDQTPAINLDAPYNCSYIGGLTAGTGGTLPPGAVVGDMYLQLFFNVNVIVQLYVTYNGGPNLWLRQRTSGAWGAWQSLMPPGVGQTWQNVAASRAFGVTYTNSTNRPIMVSVTGASAGQAAVYMDAIVSGVTVARAQLAENQTSGWGPLFGNVSFMVPRGGTYSVNPSSTSGLTLWAELR